MLIDEQQAFTLAGSKPGKSSSNRKCRVSQRYILDPRCKHERISLQPCNDHSFSLRLVGPESNQKRLDLDGLLTAMIDIKQPHHNA